MTTSPIPNTFVPSDTRVLHALKAILPVGTTIATANVYIEKSISVQAGGFPALILSIPDDTRQPETLGKIYSADWAHVVMALYLDRWDSSTRTYGQLLHDARAALNQMIANYSENISLLATYTTEDGVTVTGETNAVAIAQRIRRHVDSPVDNKELGFPLLQAWLRFDIQGLWEQWTTS